MTKAIQEEEYRMATRDFVGWCTTCEDFTRDCTEGDAEAYDCPQCEGNTVMGAENALIAGEITFKGEAGR